MDKTKFNKLSVLEQLEYVNNELIKGESLRNISSSLKMSKTTIRDRFKKIGYIFNAEQRQYIKDNYISKEVEYKHNIDIVHKNKIIDNKEIAKHEYKENINIFNNADAKNKMMDIVSKYNDLVKMIEVSSDIKEMLEWYNKQKNIIEPAELKIDSNKLIGEIKTTTVRLYGNVWKDFREFMEQYKEFKSMDIVSMALIEFMEKYKK
ncbi:hypothetical protein [Clostridium botulinum]|uniref:hypothetical protein n=1 Tax=Clostridium botulinum TaxID=1491 RepID=UPI003A803A33